jgi:hypothetical protein
MDRARRTLCEVVSTHGPGIAHEPRRLENLLNDLCGEERKAIFVLVQAAREKLPADIEPAVTRGAPALQIERSGRRLADTLGFDADLARWAAETWALALGAGCGSPAPISVSAQPGAQFQTISAALRHAPPWARIEVAPGQYVESITIERPVEIVGVALAGTSGAGSTGGVAQVNGASAGASAGARDGTGSWVEIEATGGAALRLEADFAVVRGIRLRGAAGQSLFGVDVSRGELLMEDCDVSGGELAGIAVRGKSAHATLTRCRIQGGRQAGLYFSLGGSGVAAECEIVENGGAGVEIGWKGSPVLRKCRIARNGTYGVRIYAGGDGSVEECDLAENRLGAWCVEEEAATA